MSVKTFAALGLIGGAIAGKMVADYVTTNSIEPITHYQVDALHRAYEVGYGAIGTIVGVAAGSAKKAFSK